MMKQAAGLMLFAAFLCVILPGLLIKGTDRQITQMDGDTAATEIMESAPLETGVRTDQQIILSVAMEDGAVRQMDMETYLVGVLLGEMPADFPMEAKKAQAVVSRTYTLRQSQAKKHSDGDICTDSGCCQAWKSPEPFSQEAISDAQTAVRETDGQILTHKGLLIDATFFSSSGGRTEAAVAVWGSDIPYLQAVDSPNEETPYDADRAAFPAEEFRQRILTAAPEAELRGTPENWLGEATRTDGGGVEQLTIGGVAFTGKTLRTLFGLRSTMFTVRVDGDTIVFSTQGFGHRVGMSQYGARAMALEGNSYVRILEHYYTDVTIEAYEE